MTETLCFSSVYKTLKSVFPIVCPYQIDVPSFGGPWGFCVASSSLNPATLSAKEIDSRISTRRLSLKCYDGVSHQGMFSIAMHLRNGLAEEGRLITDKKPLYVYQDL
jgi:spermidine synthase